MQVDYFFSWESTSSGSEEHNASNTSTVSRDNRQKAAVHVQASDAMHVLSWVLSMQNYTYTFPSFSLDSLWLPTLPHPKLLTVPGLLAYTHLCITVRLRVASSVCRLTNPGLLQVGSRAQLREMTC